jgi:hypothetical protein
MSPITAGNHQNETKVVTSNVQSQHLSSKLEKIVALIVSSLIVMMMLYLILLGRPFADSNLAAMARILLSLACAVLGATVPGFLNIDLSMKGVLIRAGGALALFVLTFFFAPSIIDNSVQQEGRSNLWEQPTKGMPQLNNDFMRLMHEDALTPVVSEELRKLIDRHMGLIEVMERATEHPEKQVRPSKVVALYNFLAMAHYQVAAIFNRLSALPIDSLLMRDESINHARLAEKYSDLGLAWDKQIKSEHVDLRLWNQGAYDLSRMVLHDQDIMSDLEWYRTAARAILAYNNVLPFAKVIDEVSALKRKFRTVDKPEDDDSMRWMLESVARAQG